MDVGMIFVLFYLMLCLCLCSFLSKFLSSFLFRKGPEILLSYYHA